MTNKFIKDVFFKPIARAVQKANVGLTTVLVSRETFEDVVLVVTPDTFKLFDENDEFVYDSYPIFIRYEERNGTLSFNYMVTDEVIYYKVMDRVSTATDCTDLYTFLIMKLEEIVNTLYGI